MAQGGPTPIPLPLSSSPGASPQESGGRLINCRAEPLGAEAGAKQVWRRCEGLTLQAVTGVPGFRGAILANGLIYAAIGAHVYSISSVGTVTTIGNLAGTDPVIFAHNNKSPTADIVSVNSSGAFLVLDARSVQPSIAVKANAISSSDATGQGKALAFDGDTTTEWESGETGSGCIGVSFIGQDFGAGTPQAITRFDVFQANSGIGDISSATVQWSPDAVTWTSVETFALTNPGSNQTLTWASVGAKRAWRLLANGNPGTGVAWGIYELGMSLAATTAPATVEAYPDSNLPTVNSVFFQDGYFFFTTGDKRVFASTLNDIVINALTYTTLASRSAQAGVRGVAYKGVAIVFTTSSAEIWQDTAQPFPGFPYSRLAVVDRGLLTSSAIAGDTEGFGNLLWVGDDFGVYRFSALFQPEKVSPPDLDRLIRAQASIDATQLFAGCFIADGRAIWTLSSPTWAWEFNCNSEKWNERSSFYSGIMSRWRGIGGIKAFGRWILGDDQTGNLAYIDPTNFTELGSPQLFRLESGPAHNFPNRLRVGRTDIDVVTGVGQSGSSANATDPQMMISYSDDDGVHWSAPRSRSLGETARASTRVWATSLGRTGAQGRRWRYDVSDPVYVGILGATMDANPRAR